MKKLIVFIILLSITFCTNKETSSTQTEIISRQIKFVTAKNGLFMRKEPNLNGEKIDLIPYKEKVELTEQTKKYEIIEDINDVWVKINWKNKTGWVFNGFLNFYVPQMEDIFLLYNVIPYKQLLLSNIFNTLNSNQKKSRVSVSLNLFKTRPKYIPEEEILIITRDKIIEDKIKQLYLSSFFDEILLQFDVLNNIVDYNQIFVKKQDLFDLRMNYPELITLIEIENQNKKNKFFEIIINNFDLMIDTKLINNQNKDVLINFLQNNYDYKVYQLNTPGNKEIYFCQFAQKDMKKKYYDFNYIFRNEKLIFHKNSRIGSLFIFNKTNYLVIDAWTPHSGEIGKHFYKITNNELILIKKDYTFAD